MFKEILEHICIYYNKWCSCQLRAYIGTCYNLEDPKSYGSVFGNSFRMRLLLTDGIFSLCLMAMVDDL